MNVQPAAIHYKSLNQIHVSISSIMNVQQTTMYYNKTNSLILHSYFDPQKRKEKKTFRWNLDV